MHLAKKGLSPRATRKYKALDFARILVSSTETEDQVQGGFLLDVVVREGAAIFQLLSSKDQALLIRGNSFLVLDLGLDIVNGVRGFHIQGDGLSCRIQGKERVRGWSYQIELRSTGLDLRQSCKRNDSINAAVVVAVRAIVT